nr:ERF family protein [uncultured Acetatifactor sp.]
MGEAAKSMIYSAICGVMEDIGVVGKNDTNKQQGFKYRGIDSVMNALNPAMIKHKIFCVPEVLEQTREERTTAKGASLIYSVCKMRYRFYATDGSNVEAVVVGEGMDSGDKATNKAMSVAFKYACFQTFCIPTEDMMDDPDADSHESTRKGDRGASQTNSDDERNRLLEELKGELVRTGYGWGAVTKTYKVDSVDNLTKLQIKDCITKMKKQPDKVAS